VTSNYFNLFFSVYLSSFDAAITNIYTSSSISMLSTFEVIYSSCYINCLLTYATQTIQSTEQLLVGFFST